MDDFQTSLNFLQIIELHQQAIFVSGERIYT